MAKQILTPLVLVPSGANSSGLQLSKLLAGGASTPGSSPIGVDGSGNVVLMSGLAQTVTVDLGSVPTSGMTFTVPATGLTVGTPVTCSLSGVFANGAFADEFEMEPMAVYGMVQSPTAFTFSVVCTDPTLLTVGKRLINFYLG